MDRNLKIFIVAMLATIFMMQKRICQDLSVEQSKHHSYADTASVQKEVGTVQLADTSGDYFINDSIYRWHKRLFDWVTLKEDELLSSTTVAAAAIELKPDSAPIEAEWETLMDIKYRLKYYASINMEMFAPVFSEAVKALDGKEVIIKGYVIPFDHEGELLALSANPFTSCFFCGRASPASVISVHLRNKGKQYDVDKLREFRGTLSLNRDNPEEFYYILQNAY